MTGKLAWWIALAAVLVAVALLAPRALRPTPTSPPMTDFILKSTAFKEGETIPAKYTCDGDDVNPFLEIKNPPEGAVSFALVVDDPDAPGGTWDHWLVWNIDPRTQYLSEDHLPDDAVQGKTSFGHVKYGGPCPPRGDKSHHYIFTLYALDVMLGLPAGADKAALLAAVEGHVLGTATLTGLYQRK